ncbi:MAG: flagellar assembly protein FliW [Helicobacter sp.]|nr:flagellar assembly protein FliW [Helicobacter sp.]MDE7317690.1 flagellar assembly protein FliW [Helicobacter sp.]
MNFEVKSPILGFEGVTRMSLERLEENDELFMRLRNCDGEAPTFTMVNPFMLRNYVFEMPIAIQALLDVRENTSLLILNMMVIASPLENSTINFLAPVVFNFDNQTMGQVVLESMKYPEYGIAEPISGFFTNE